MAKLSYMSQKQTHTLKPWSSKGIRNMGHLLRDSTHFLSFEDLTECFNIKTNFLTFQGLISVIKALWKCNGENLHNITTNYKTFTYTSFKAWQPNRLTYKILVGKKQKKTGWGSKKMDCGLSCWNPRKHWLGHSLPIIFSLQKDLKTNCLPI